MSLWHSTSVRRIAGGPSSVSTFEEQADDYGGTEYSCQTILTHSEGASSMARSHNCLMTVACVWGGGLGRRWDGKGVARILMT